MVDGLIDAIGYCGLACKGCSNVEKGVMRVPLDAILHNIPLPLALSAS